MLVAMTTLKENDINACFHHVYFKRQWTMIACKTTLKTMTSMFVSMTILRQWQQCVSMTTLKDNDINVCLHDNCKTQWHQCLFSWQLYKFMVAFHNCLYHKSSRLVSLLNCLNDYFKKWWHQCLYAWLLYKIMVSLQIFQYSLVFQSNLLKMFKNI